MGLIQNQVEGAGVATVSMTVQPHITAAIGAPRAVFLRYPAGNQVGEAGKPQQQRAILIAALEAAYHAQTPGAILELPYRWRRFPIEEHAIVGGASQGARHPQSEAIGEALDTLVRRSQEYRKYLESRQAEARANPDGPHGLDGAVQQQIDRVDELIKLLDREVLDQYREIVNAVATLELRASGKFV